MDNNSTILQLNEFYQAFLVLYIKPQLKQQVPQLDKLISKHKPSQALQYLNQILNQYHNKHLNVKQEEILSPILKKAYTFKSQQQIIEVNRPISTQKVNFHRRNSQRNHDSNSVDNNAQHIPHRKIVTQQESKQGNKYALIIKKLKDLFEVNNKKIKKYNELSISDKNLPKNNLRKMYSTDTGIKKY